MATSSLDHTRMASDDDVKNLILTGVKFSGRELGRGAYGIVLEVEYNGTTCAAKQTHSILLEQEPNAIERIRHNFLGECLLHSKLDNPNIVKMLGICYPQGYSYPPPPGKLAVLPVLVMELMEYTLTALLETYPDISMYLKLSILQDVSRGVYYLHSLDPPVIYRDLSSNNILLTDKLVAKISDFAITKVMSPIEEESRHSGVPGGTVTFMPPEALLRRPHFDLSSDVFSFGCVVCHVVSQQWPEPLDLVEIDRETFRLWAKTEVERRQHYIDQISDKSLQQLVISCLDNIPQRRPPMSQTFERITRIITSHYFNDNSVKMAYSLAMKEGVAKSRDLQVLLVGAETTGKTCLISSFLGEEFVEGQAATEAVSIDICKIYCKNWSRISNSDKTDLLHHQFVDQLGEKALDIADNKNETLISTSANSFDLGVKNLDIPPQHQFFDQLKGRVIKQIMPLTAADNIASFSSRPVVKSNEVMSTSSVIASTSSTSNSSEHLPETHPQQYLQAVSSNALQYSLNLTLWDFPGQVIFHNTHSVFISKSGVVAITFNASMELTSKAVPREGSPAPPECATIISSIHYWLQVVDSMCSVKGREGDLSPLQPPVILAGTHIDLLHPDIKVARKIAKKMILPPLIHELSDKPYAQHLVGMGDGIESALEQSCFFISNKCRDEEIEHVKSMAIEAATSLKKVHPIYFLKIEQAVLQHKEQVISKSTMVEVVTECTFSIAENSPEFEGVLRYLHDKRVILYFSQVRSLEDLVILSPQWLARLFSYIITAHSYKRGKGFDETWKRLTKYGILHESLLQHMLDKFHSDYPSVIKVSKEQVIDILLCFHLVARITREAWFNEESYPSLPGSGDTFIVPSLVPYNDRRNPPNTNQERIVYFKFDKGFIPTSLLNQLIADCICRNVERNSRLLWMRHGMVGLQLGADQAYYISRCEEKKSIQLTITMPLRNNVKSGEERRELIDDITRLLDDIMKVFMPAVKKRPVLLVPCPSCPVLHITLDEVCNGATIFCTASGKTDPLRGYYGDLLPYGLHFPTILPGANRKLEVFTNYFANLTEIVPFKEWSHHFVSARIITNEDNRIIQNTVYPYEIASRVLNRIYQSLKLGMIDDPFNNFDDPFDKLLSIMEQYGNMSCVGLAKEIRGNTSNATQSSHDEKTPRIQLSTGTRRSRRCNIV